MDNGLQLLQPIQQSAWPWMLRCVGWGPNCYALMEHAQFSQLDGQSLFRIHNIQSLGASALLPELQSDEDLMMFMCRNKDGLAGKDLVLSM